MSGSKMGRSMAERFADKYIPEPNSGCWLWVGHYDHHYGRIKGYGGRSARALLAHRVSWELHRGPIPAGMNVCHKCDVPLCVNPSHLFLGTDLDNVRDKIAKGRLRVAIGEDSGQAKLTEGQVRAIRSATGSQSSIAAQYGIRQQTVSRIKSRSRWQHLGD